MKLKQTDQFIHIHKKSFLQRIADLSRTGHQSYVLGLISLDRAATLALKFQQRFKTDVDKYAASRMRKAGQATTRLLMYLPAPDAEEVLWILLQCPGAELDSSERWRDALSDRIVITGYELVRLTKPQENHPLWTWRYTREREAELREEIIRCVRSRQDLALEQLIHTIYRTPGFAGARAQVKKMADLIRREWKVRRKSSDAMPKIPDRIGYLQRVADHGIRLSKLLETRSAGRTVVAGSRRIPKSRHADPQTGKPSTPQAAVQGHELVFPVILPELLESTSDSGEVNSSLTEK